MHIQDTVSRLLILIILFFAIGLFVIGLFAPLMTLKKGFFYIYLSGQPVSIVYGLWQFLLEENYILFFLIFGFTVVFPLFKFYMLFKICLPGNQRYEKSRRIIRQLSHISKWSMLDVFVVAILIVAVKIRSIAKVEVHYGLYFFTISILITMVLTYLVANPGKRHSKTAASTD